jgi:hypothetical protein
MKAITIRDTNGKLVCFGPAGRGYDPGVPVDCVKAIEDDYEVVRNEYADNYVAPVIADPIKDRLDALEAQIGLLNAKQI